MTKEEFANRGGIRSKVARLPLLLEAFCYLVLARAAVSLLPFGRLLRWIGAPSEPAVEEVTIETIQSVRWAVAVAVRRLAPWAVCLPQAIAGHWMLRRRGIASVVCFGVGRDPAAKLGAHAWLRTADRVVLGERTMTGFAPIAEFPTGLPMTSVAEEEQS